MRPAPAPSALPSLAAPVPRPAGAARLAGVGAVVFLANAGLLVLQLAAGRLLAPFVGSSLGTWTAIIGAFLAGIALGNAVGGRLADRSAGGRKLAAFLALGGLAALWMVALPVALDAAGAHHFLPLRARIVTLATLLCFPPGFVLSLVTPLAVKLGTPDVRRAGRAAGMVFALGTLGCLVGNYLTGFYLIPNLTVNGIVLATAGLLFATAGLALLIPTGGTEPHHQPNPTPPNGHPAGFPVTPSPPHPLTPSPPLPLRTACLIVFLSSFAGMTLELTAARLMAQLVGVSLFTWTGVIGVMLAGTAVGNWVGGVLADRCGAADPAAGPARLGTCLTLAAAAAVGVLVVFFVGVHADLFDGLGLIARVLAWTLVLFFVPMMLLGTVSPQAVRLAVPDVAHAGRVAGRVYAWSTAGAIAGTFATGFLVLSVLGMYRTILLAAVLPGVAALRAARVWDRPPLLYALSVVFGAAAGGFVLLSPANTRITAETNYYTITVKPDDRPTPRPPGAGADAAGAVAGPAGAFDPPGAILRLQLDMLVHSWVKPGDPTYLKYAHEQTQLEVLRGLAAAHPGGQNVLVIGGGGYTFPRAARTLVPTAAVDVAEIDRGVTKVSYDHLALDPKLLIRSHHLDGRQFLAERAPPGYFHLITLDAVNDLTVPSHLLTREFNDLARAALTPDGVYLLTVIDRLEDGTLWKAAVHTLRKTFPHVEVLSPHPVYEKREQQVYVIYAAAAPLDLDRLRDVLAARGVDAPVTHRLPEEADRMLGAGRPVVLTDQFAPVDNMMAEVFRRRKEKE